jgi:MFS superfamily sulfate permease-like transporter
MLPWLSWEDARAILPVALAVSLLTFSDSTIIARAFAARNRYRINANRELLALGAANIAAGLTQALPVGASGSRTAVLEASGGRSQTAALVAAVVVIACLVFLTDFFRFLPAAALAGILITAALSLIDLEEFRRIWRFGWIGLVGALLTLAGVVAYGMIEGIALGVLFSMLNLLHSLAFPDDAVLGEHTTGDYADLALSPPPRSVAGLLIYRFGAPLIFVNSGRFRDRIEQLIEEAPSEVRGVIVDASQMLRIDLAAAELLVEIGQDLADRGIRFALCCANPQVEAALKKLDLDARRPPLTIHANIAGARGMLLGDRASTD